MKGEEPIKYTAFIAYRHSPASRPQAERLESALKRFAKPLWRQPIAIFRNERILRPGDDLPGSLRTGLQESEFLIFLASKDAAASEWIKDELRIWCEELNLKAH
jgi:TIR domain